ncbi:MAG: EAL domain-containing protein [Acidimicrobiales bacterium]
MTPTRPSTPPGTPVEAGWRGSATIYTLRPRNASAWRTPCARRCSGEGLDVAYQRIVDIASGDTLGVEALARWTHAALGPVPPAQFIPMAEGAGLIPTLDLHVIDKALDEVVRRRVDRPDFGLSVNVSGQTLTGATFERDLIDRVAARGVPFAAVTLEILEAALLAPGAVVTAANLRRAGFRLALDDFGGGGSSLKHFVTFSADELKIDRSTLVSAAEGNERALTLLRLIVEASTELGMSVVAEGVEGPAELEVCHLLGVARAQGYMWGSA